MDQPIARPAQATDQRDTDLPLWWSSQERNFRLGFTSIDTGNLSLNHGDSASHNRSRLEAWMGISAGSLKFLHQTHSTIVCDADSINDEEIVTGDAWVSDGGEALAVLVADCLPVIFTAETAEGRCLGAVAHAGRVGLVDGILENTVSALRDRGAVSMSAWLGPCICAGCYEIPADMVAELSHQRPQLGATSRWGTSSIDLRGYAQFLLETDAVRVNHVPDCTMENTELFSHRRSATDPGATGRIAALIWPAV